jgi:glutamate synthase domain-containing protein 3
MKNLFLEFKDYRPKERQIPLDKITASEEGKIQELIEAYDKCVKQVKEEKRQEEAQFGKYPLLERMYTNIEQRIENIQYGTYEIQEVLSQVNKTPDLGILGLFISVLCNHVKEQEIILNLQNEKLKFLGYRLPKERKLIVHGDLGDYVGIELDGGELIVEGNVGNWAGANMKIGKLIVRGNAGAWVGNNMTNGEIYVEGMVYSVGDRKGGEIFNKKMGESQD